MLHALSFLEISILKIVLLCEEIICHQKKKKFWFVYHNGAVTANCRNRFSFTRD